MTSHEIAEQLVMAAQAIFSVPNCNVDATEVDVFSEVSGCAIEEEPNSTKLRIFLGVEC